jgi:hypothetical protein
VLRQNDPDVEGYLFGRDRIPLQRAGDALKHHYGSSCFYCRIRPASEVDHVLPWSLYGIDGLINLVPACRICNSNKSQSIPAVRHVKEALGRCQVLESVAGAIGWPTEFERVVSAAKGLYATRPDCSPLWSAVGDYTTLDTSERTDVLEFLEGSSD